MVIKTKRLRQSAGDGVFLAIVYVLVLLLTAVTFYPLLYVVMASFSDSDLLLGHSGPLWLPLGANIKAYASVLGYKSVWVGYANTIIIVGGGLCVSLFLTTLGAYFMTRKRTLLAKPFAFFALFTMYFGGGLVPMYLNMKELGLHDALLGVILLGGLNTYNMIIMRTNFQAIPDSLEESAVIDGAGDITILTKIILPLSSTAIAVMVLYYGVAFWNGWFYPMILLQTRSKMPLQLVLREILIQNQSLNLWRNEETVSIEMTVKYAIIMISCLPIMFAYPFLQKYFIKGVMIGSIKG